MDLGQYVLHTAQFQHVAHARPRFDAGARARGNQDHATGPKPPDDPMRDSVALELDALLTLHAFLGVLGGLLYCGWHFVGFAVTAGDSSPAIADNDQRVEAEA